MAIDVYLQLGGIKERVGGNTAGGRDLAANRVAA